MLLIGVGVIDADVGLGLMLIDVEVVRRGDDSCSIKSVVHLNFKCRECEGPGQQTNVTINVTINAKQ